MEKAKVSIWGNESEHWTARNFTYRGFNTNDDTEWRVVLLTEIMIFMSSIPLQSTWCNILAGLPLNTKSIQKHARNLQDYLNFDMQHQLQPTLFTSAYPTKHFA